MESKTLKGQAWIMGDSLVQDQILVIPGQISSDNVIVLIDDIWADLTSEDHEYKTNGNGYFYWEYQMTDIESDDITNTVKFGCPKPKAGVFEAPYDVDAVSGDYAKYWVAKLKISTENYENRIAIQRKEVTFPGSTYYDGNGNLVEVSDITVKNDDLGDITNLLNLF